MMPERMLVLLYSWSIPPPPLLAQRLLGMIMIGQGRVNFISSRFGICIFGSIKETVYSYFLISACSFCYC